MLLKLLLFCILLTVSVLAMNFNNNPNYVVQTIRNYRQTRQNLNQQSPQGPLIPHLEILQLAEILLKFKGEIASRTQTLINDNYDLIRSVYFTLMSKIGNLHNFTLTGIRILRQILQYANNLLQQWQYVPVPSSQDGSTTTSTINQPIRINGVDFF